MLKDGGRGGSREQNMCEKFKRGGDGDGEEKSKWRRRKRDEKKQQTMDEESRHDRHRAAQRVSDKDMVLQKR